MTGRPLIKPSVQPSAICLDCRTALGKEERCDGGRYHRVVGADGGEGRAHWRHEVWGPPPLRKQAVGLAKAGGSGAGFGIVLESCGACEWAAAPEAALVALVVGLIFGGVYWLATSVTALYRRVRHQLKPRGAVEQSVLGAARQLGRVSEGTMMRAPTGEGCLAFAIELRQEDAGVMLRHAETAGVEVALDDGSRLQVPPGRIRLEGKSEHESLGQTTLEETLPLLRGLAQDEGDLNPAPFDAIHVIHLQRGNRVEVHGALESEADGSSGSGSYRGSPNLLRKPAGIVTLRILPAD